MSETGRITGTVRDTAGQPIADAVVMITGNSPSHRDIAALTTQTGSYRLDGLIPGQYTVMVNAEARATQILNVDVHAGEVSRLDFEV